MHEHVVQSVLEPYMARIGKRRGNGLSRNMNRTLDSYPNIGQIIRRSFDWLVHAEATFRFSGVYVRTYHLYWDLLHAHADWGVDVPSTTDFRRRVSLPYNQFAAAITVARRIGLFSGHGRVGFSNAVRDRIQACVEPHQLSS